MLGITLSVLAALCFGIATAVQKYCLKGVPKFSFKVLFKNRLWMLSLLLGLAGILFYLAALKFAEISLVQPMLSISIIVPVLIGWFFFGENVGDRWIHVLIIIMGVLLLSL
jgi:drug/metabolite transporter (DMT)-like permease